MKRIAVFVDGSNLYYTQKKLGWEIDPKRMLDYCKGYGEVVEAIYYTGASNEGNQRKFHDWLAYNGYQLHRPARRQRNGRAQASRRGSGRVNAFAKMDKAAWYNTHVRQTKPDKHYQSGLNENRKERKLCLQYSEQ